MRRFLPLILLFVIQSCPAMAQDASAEVVLLEDIAWSPDGTRIAGVYSDSNVAIWSVDDLSDPLLTFQAELADLVTWTADSKYLIAQGRQFDEMGQIGLSVTKWDADTGELSETLFALEMVTTFEFDSNLYNVLPSIALDLTGTRAALSLRDGLVRLSGGYHILFLEHPNTTNYVHYMEWSPDNHYLAVVYGGSDTYTIQIFNVESEELILVISQDFQYFVTDLRWDASGAYLATSSMRYTCCEGWSNLGVYNIETESELRTFLNGDLWKTEIARYAAPIDWHPTEFILAYADEDSIEIYNPDEPEPLFTIAVDEAKDIEWSPDGTQIASISRDGALAMWDVSL